MSACRGPSEGGRFTSFQQANTKRTRKPCQDRGLQGGALHSSVPLVAGATRLGANRQRAEPVGHYAVRFDFSDGHGTGIYSFEYLRRVCPCEECRAKRTGEEA